MKGNLSKRKGLLSSITQKELDIIAAAISEQKEDKKNKVTSLSKLSTDTQYPSARSVYSLIENLQIDSRNLQMKCDMLDNSKVDKVEGKGLSTNDYTTEDKVALQTAQTQISDLLLYLNSKVDKVSGKGLSTNDFTDDEKGKLAGLPTSQELTSVFEQKANKVTDINGVSTDTQYPSAKAVFDTITPIGQKAGTANTTANMAYNQIQRVQILAESAQPKTTIEEHPPEAFPFTVGENNTEYRLTAEAITTLAIDFPNGEYDKDYIEGLVFNSGSTPTHVSYTSTGIIQWIGTDCFISDDNKSIFKPSANTQYDIVFYYNGGNYIVGLVNGYKVTTGNQEANA